MLRIALNTVIDFPMKTSLDLPDHLYRRVKSKSALEGRAVREVATALFTAWWTGGYQLSNPTEQRRKGSSPIPASSGSPAGENSRPTSRTLPAGLEAGWINCTATAGERDARCVGVAGGNIDGGAGAFALCCARRIIGAATRVVAPAGTLRNRSLRHHCASDA